MDAVLSGKHTTSDLQIGENFCQVIANPVLRDKEVTGAVLLLVDITEKIQRENLRREFTANVSHELKTPLTSISGFAEIIQDGFVKPETSINSPERFSMSTEADCLSRGCDQDITA